MSRLFFAQAVIASMIWAAPPLTGRLNDTAGVFTPAQKATLNLQLSELEKAPGHPQMFVLITKSLDGRDIADYSGDVARAWKVGRKEKDNGVLFVGAPNERKIRLEIGYGLEGSIPDVRAKSILNKMKPLLVKGHEDWAAAVSVAITEIQSALGEKHASTH
jgi:uncharacterized protein